MGNLRSRHIGTRYITEVGPNVVRPAIREDEAISSKELHKRQQHQGIKGCEGGRQCSACIERKSKRSQSQTRLAGRRRRRIYLRSSASSVASLTTTIFSVLKVRTRRRSRIGQQHRGDRSSILPIGGTIRLVYSYTYRREVGIHRVLDSIVAQRFGQGPLR